MTDINDKNEEVVDMDEVTSQDLDESPIDLTKDNDANALDIEDVNNSEDK